MGFLFIQRLRLRLRQRLRRVSCTSAARQHGRRRSSRLRKNIGRFSRKAGRPSTSFLKQSLPNGLG